MASHRRSEVVRDGAPEMKVAPLLLACVLAASADAVSPSKPSFASSRRAVATRQAANEKQAAMQLATVQALRGGSAAAFSHKPLAALAFQMVLGLVAIGSIALSAMFLHVLALVTKGPSLSESGMRSRRWDQLKDQIRANGQSVADGAAAQHTAEARTEAARKLVMNHERVLHDITRSDGPPRTQPNLKRLSGEQHDVDAALIELSRRLLGRNPGAHAQWMKPTTVEQASVWAATADYLSARIQSTSEEMASTQGHEHRAPDMSEAAAAAMRGVLSELAAEEVALTYTQRFKKAIGASVPAEVVRPTVNGP